MTWNTLTEEQHLRLCECRSFKSDIVPIAKAYMVERNYGPETALEVTLEHLYANSQDFDLTDEEWCRAIGKLEKFGRTLVG